MGIADTYNIITGMRSIAKSSAAAQILTAQRVRDVANEISLLDVNQTALLTLLRRLRKKMTVDPKFEWHEDTFLPKATSAVGAFTSGDYSAIVFAKAYARAGDVWLNADSGEMIYVVAVSGVTLSQVIRGVGGTTVSDIASGDTFIYIGNAQQTGANSRTSMTTQRINKYNYTQLFKESFEVDRTAGKTKLYGGPDMVYLRRKHGIEHNRDIERAFWFGGIDLLTATDAAQITTAAHMTKGIVTHTNNSGFITENVSSGDSGGYSEDNFDEDLRTAFRYGNMVKFCFGAPLPYSVISSWARGKLQTVPRDQTYGIHVTRYISPHGELNLVNNKLFFDMSGGGDVSGAGWDFTKMMVILDLENLWYRFLRDTQLEMGIQDNDKDSDKDQYLTECGLQLRNQETCMVIHDVAYA